MTERVIEPLSDKQLQKSIYIAALLALFLPPFIGGTLMGIVGYHPLPEFYFTFFSYTGLYVACVTLLVLPQLPRVYRYIVNLAHMERKKAELKARYVFIRFPWFLLVTITIYSIFGALSVDFSMESLGYRYYTLQDHLHNQFGIIPVVLITTFPIFFYFVDRLGRYLSPRGLSVIAVPLWLKLLMLGIVTPILINSLLISYYFNRTGYIGFTTLILWFSLLGIAIGSTWFAWRSLRQSTMPLEQYLASKYDECNEDVRGYPVPLSLDEFGVLTSRFGSFIRKQNELNGNLIRTESLANAVINDAGALVVVLNNEGRIVRFNRACEHISGYSFEEVENKFPWDTVLPPESANLIREQAFDILANDPSVMSGYYVNEWVSRKGERSLVEWNNTVIIENKKMEYVVSVGIDITERDQAEKTLLKNSEQLNEAQRIAKLGSWTFDITAEQLVWSDEIFKLFELDKEQIKPSYHGFINMVHPEERELVDQIYTNSLKNRQSYKLTHRLLFDDGRVKFVDETCETTFDEAGKALISHGTVQDVTERELAQKKISLYASVFRHSAEAIMITDSDNRIVAINPALAKLTGYNIDELIGKSPKIISSELTPKTTYKEMWNALNSTGYWHGELIDQRKNGETYPKRAAISVVLNDQGKVVNYIASFSDITERKEAEEHIFRLAHHDVLTGLFNRLSLEDRMGQAIVQAKRDDAKLAVMFIDLDRFKIINDTLGHHVGDALLVKVAKRLRKSVRDSDIVARLGGDEFVIVLTGLEDIRLVASIAKQIVKNLAMTYKIDDHELRSTPSIGISTFPRDGINSDDLMKNADTAMYHAKDEGRNNYQFYTDEFNKIAHERMTLEYDLRVALEKEQFELHYQPKIDTLNGNISGLEALVRWNHPERGLLMPDKFISIAEETGLIEPIGDWVLNEACRQSNLWRCQEGISLNMSVNLSPKQLRDPKLVNRLQEIMKKYQIGENELELEITENSVMTNTEQAIKQMIAIREAGVYLAIDDFGTGYSSLAYLKSFPIQVLKIDRTFVRDIEEDEDDAAICRATISLSHDLGLKVVAEGVETEAQRDFLISHKCDTLQGYLFSRPLPSDEILKYIKQNAK
jgi:diguanylate cyclase (GGDEF)-like protein/PAS domain S-box-containing protein